jgi:hypothetical protein
MDWGDSSPLSTRSSLRVKASAPMFLPPWLWRILRARRTRTLLLWSPFIAIAIVALFYFGANRWGERVFRGTVDELEARGFPRTMERASFDVPRDEDFFAHPVVIAEMENSPAKTKLGSVPELGLPGLKPGFYREPHANRHKGKVPDFRPLFVDPPATSELAAARTWQELQLLEDRRQQLLDLSFSKAPLDLHLNSGGSPRIAFFSGVTAFFNDHALTSLQAGHPDDAAEDLRFLLSFAAAFQESISGSMHGIISVGVSAMPLHGIHEAARIGAFDEARWAELDRAISRLQPSRTPATALRFNASVDMELLLKGWDRRTEGREFPEWQLDWTGEGLGSYLKSIARHLRPQGFQDRDIARMLLAQADFAQPDGKSWRGPVTPEDFRQAASKHKEFERGTSSSSTTSIALPDPPEQLVWSVLQITIAKSLKLEAELALARHAIALERHRLRHGNHPPSLDTLDPDLREALPPDPMSGGTLHYRPEPSGGFTMWSVGLDGIDNASSSDDLPWQRP